MLHGYYVTYGVPDMNTHTIIKFYNDPDEFWKLQFCGFFLNDIKSTIFNENADLRKEAENLLSMFEEDIRYTEVAGFIAFLSTQDLSKFYEYYQQKLFPLFLNEYLDISEVPLELTYCVKSITYAQDSHSGDEFTNSDAKCSTASELCYLLPADMLSNGNKKFLLSTPQMRYLLNNASVIEFSSFDELKEFVFTVSLAIGQDPKKVYVMLMYFLITHMKIFSNTTTQISALIKEVAAC